MRSFWLSLLLFVLLLCSCKTKEIGHEVNFTTKGKIDSQRVSIQSFIDTTNVHKIFIDNSRLEISETITIKEYDKDTGVLTKETEEKKSIRQDTQTNRDETENRGITEANKDSTNHIEDKLEMVKTKEEVKEESVMSGMFDNIGKWLGIGIVVLIGIAITWKKIKKFLPL